MESLIGIPEHRDCICSSDYTNRPAEPINPYEPVDSSAAAIGAQGLLRLGRLLREEGTRSTGRLD